MADIKTAVAADLINRQQSDIERLKQPPVVSELEVPKELIDRMKREKVIAIRYDEEQIRAEAIKEFAERLKECLGSCRTVHDYVYVGYDSGDTLETIDNLVKEMVGDK